MQKNEIILARVISTVSAAALALLILTAGIGSGYFLNIANKINNNTFQDEGANLYNYYYYTGFHVVYRFLFIITVMALVVSILCILFRLRNCQRVCMIAGISSLITGIFLLFGRVYESSVGVHRFVDGFYMGNVSSSQIVTSQYLPKFPLSTVFFLIIALLFLTLVRVTRFEKIKLYQKSDFDGIKLLTAGIYGSVVLDVVWGSVIRGLAFTLDLAEQTSYLYLQEYFIAERWVLRLPLVIYAVLAMVLTVILKEKLKERYHQLIAIGVPTAAALLVGIYCFFNPTRIFGTLTLDEHICDITEAAMNWYLVMMAAAVLLTATMIYYTYMQMPFKKMAVLMAVNGAAVLLLAVSGMLMIGLPGIYAGIAAAHLLSAVFLLVKKPEGKKGIAA